MTVCHANLRVDGLADRSGYFEFAEVRGDVHDHRVRSGGGNGRIRVIQPPAGHDGRAVQQRADVAVGPGQVGRIDLQFVEIRGPREYDVKTSRSKGSHGHAANPRQGVQTALHHPGGCSVNNWGGAIALVA